jgi:hypothetical protein
VTDNETGEILYQTEHLLSLKGSVVAAITILSPNGEMTLLPYAIGRSENNELLEHLLDFCIKHGLDMNQSKLTIYQ